MTDSPTTAEIVDALGVLATSCTRLVERFESLTRRVECIEALYDSVGRPPRLVGFEVDAKGAVVVIGRDGGRRVAGVLEKTN